MDTQETPPTSPTPSIRKNPALEALMGTKPTPTPPSDSSNPSKSTGKPVIQTPLWMLQQQQQEQEAKERKFDPKWVIVAGLIGVAFLVGWVVNSTKSTPSSTVAVAEAPHEVPNHAIPETNAKEEETLQEKIDRRISENRFEGAIQLIHQGIKEKKLKATPGLTYREALCLEGLHQWKSASDLYETITTRDRWNLSQAAAALGQIRCRIGNHHEEDARQLISQFTLYSGNPALKAKPFLSEVAYLRVMLESTPLPITQLPKGFDSIHLAWYPKTMPVHRYLDWADEKSHDEPIGVEPKEHPPEDHKDPHPEQPKEHPKADHKSKVSLDHTEAETSKQDHANEEVKEGITVQKDAKKSTHHLISGQVSQKEVMSFLKELAKQTGVPIHWEAPFEERLSGRTISIQVEKLALEHLLEAIAEQFHLHFDWRKGELHLSLPKMEDSSDPKHRYDRVRAVLGRAISDAPEHPANLAMQIDLINIDYLDGHLREAKQSYDATLRENYYSEEALYLAYNLGLTQYRLNEWVAARKTFVQVIDRATSARWKALGWGWMGRSYLDGGESSQATKHLNKSLSNASNTDLYPIVVLHLASAYLLNEEPQSAQNLLKQNRRIWKEENLKATAELFDCLVRFRGKSRPGLGVMDDAEEALHRLTDSSIVGPAGIYLLGQIYRELERPVEMVKLYEKTVETSRGALAIQMIRELGDYYFDLELHKKAKSCYQAIVIVDTKANATHAKIRLAEITFNEEQFDESLQFCREALKEDTSKRDLILPIMGKTFEKKKDFPNAARCFAGLNPEE